jgi:hypothetical protein
MLSALLLGLLAATPPASAQGVRPKQAPEEEQDGVRRRITAIEAEIRLRREEVVSSGSEYERLKSQRALEESEQALREAKVALDRAKRDLKPGTEEWNRELLIKDGRQFRSIPGRDKPKKPVDEDKYDVSVPEVGPGAELDPRVSQHNWVGELGPRPGAAREPIRLPTVPGTDGSAGPVAIAPPGEVQYGRPAGYRNSPLGPIRDPRERQRRRDAEPASRLPNAPIPPSTGTIRRAEEPAEGGPVEFRLSGGEGPRALPLLAPDGFTFDAPEGELLRRFPEIRLRSKAERGEDLARIRAAGRYLRVGDPASALREADRLVESAPDDPGVHELRALILNRLGRHADAKRAAERALALDDSRASVWRTLAWSLFRLGDDQGALDASEKALALDPNDASAAAIKAYALERLGDRGAALRAIRRAAALNPSAFSAAAANAAAGAPVAPTAAPARVPAKSSPAEPARERPVWPAAGAAALAGGFAFALWRILARKG